MIENGTYMSASEAFLVDTQERNRVANQIYFFLRDGMDEMPEELCLLYTSAIGAGVGVWGVINLLEGYGNDNPGAKSQGIKQFMANRCV